MRFAGRARSATAGFATSWLETSFPAVVSRVVRLRLAYDPPDEGAPGSSVIFKTRHPERTSGESIGGRQEVAFYSQVALAMSAHLVSRCFDAQWDEKTKAWHLVLEDLSESHTSPTRLAAAADDGAVRQHPEDPGT
jgi:hypothetical protein